MSLRPGGTREWLLTTGLPARPRASLRDARGNEVAPPAPSDESLGYSRVVPPGPREARMGGQGIPVMNHWAKLACPSGTVRPAASGVPEGQTKRIRCFRCRVADGRPSPASRRDERNKPSVFNAGLTRLSIPLRPGGTRERKARLSEEVLRSSVTTLPLLPQRTGDCSRRV